MAFTAKVYCTQIKNQYDGTTNGSIDWDTNTIKVAMTTSSYTPDQDTHDFFNDVTNEVAAGSGYTSGGQTLDSCTVTLSGGANTITLDAADEAFTTFSATYRDLIIYKDTGTASTSPLMAYMQESGDQTGGGGTYTLVWNANGLVQFTVS